MATATIIRVWQDALNVNIAVSVVEAGSKNFEYIGSVSLTDDLASVGFGGKTWAQLTNAEKKTALTTAVKAVRDARLNTQTDVAGITGTVTI